MFKEAGVHARQTQSDKEERLAREAVEAAESTGAAATGALEVCQRIRCITRGAPDCMRVLRTATLAKLKALIGFL